jgi:hypothetical protein
MVMAVAAAIPRILNSHIFIAGGFTVFAGAGVGVSGVSCGVFVSAFSRSVTGSSRILASSELLDFLASSVPLLDVAFMVRFSG